MEVCSIQRTSQFKSTPGYLSCYLGKRIHGDDQAWVNMRRNSTFASLSTRRISRRLVLELFGFTSIVLHPGVALGEPNPRVETKEAEVGRILKLPSGVQFEEIVEGEGPKAQEGDYVEINYACRRYNGYFVHSTVDQFSGESTPVILTLLDNQIIQGLKEVLIGMRAGGKRRALIPPSAGYVNETLQPIPEEFGPRRSLLSHVNESLVFEVQLLKVL